MCGMRGPRLRGVLKNMFKKEIRDEKGREKARD